MTKGVVAVIPVRSADLARMGGMPRAGGTSLLGYTVRAAQEAERIERVILTSDDEEARREAASIGAEAPFRRPPELVGPEVSLAAVLQHVVRWIDDAGGAVEVVVPLEISHPLRPRHLVDQVVDALISDDMDTVFAAFELRSALWRVNAYGELQRLEGQGDDETRATRGPVYKELAGLASATRAELVRAGRRVGSRVGIVPVRDASALVDTQDEAGLALFYRLLGDSTGEARGA